MCKAPGSGLCDASDALAAAGDRAKYAKWLLLVVAAGAAVRIALVLTSSIWYDEAASIFQASQPLPVMFHMLRNAVGEPLYLLLLKIWMLLLGNGEHATALLSAVISTAGIVVIYLFAGWLLGPEVGLMSALMLAFNAIDLHNATNVRFYALVNMLAILSWWTFLRHCISEKSPWPFAVVTVLGLHTHTYFYFLVFAQICCLVLFYRRRILSMFPTLALAGLAYLPWFLFVFLHQLRGAIGTNMPPIGGLGGAVWVFGCSLVSKITHLGPTAIAVLFALIVFFAFWVFVIARRLRGIQLSAPVQRVEVLLFGFTVSIGVPILISLARPIFLAGRYDVIGLAAVVVSVACGLDALLRRIGRRSLYVAVVAVIVLSVAPWIRWLGSGRLDGDRRIIQQVGTMMTERDVEVFTGYAALPALYYMDQLGIPCTRRFFLPGELARDPNFQDRKYMQENAALQEEAARMISDLAGQDWDHLFFFYTDIPAMRPIRVLFEQGFNLDQVLPVPQHTWGPLYRDILILSKKSA
jgi:hypothetical protein